jgi:hypothetical protein
VLDEAVEDAPDGGDREGALLLARQPAASWSGCWA